VVDGAHFSNRGDHGKHERRRLASRRPQGGTNLDLENIVAFQRDADGSPAQVGIGLFGVVEIREKLVAADIQGANRDGFIRKGYLAPAFLTFYRFSIGNLNDFTSVRAFLFHRIDL